LEDFPALESPQSKTLKDSIFWRILLRTSVSPTPPPTALGVDDDALSLLLTFACTDILSLICEEIVLPPPPPVPFVGVDGFAASTTAVD